MLHESEGCHLSFVAREEKHPERDCYGSHGAGRSRPKEYDGQVTEHLRHRRFDAKEMQSLRVDDDRAEQRRRSQQDHDQVPRRPRFAEALEEGLLSEGCVFAKRPAEECDPKCEEDGCTDRDHRNERKHVGQAIPHQHVADRRPAC